MAEFVLWGIGALFVVPLAKLIERALFPIPQNDKIQDASPEFSGSPVVTVRDAATLPRFDYDWRRFWHLFTTEDLGAAEQAELQQLKTQLHEIQSLLAQEDRKKAEDIRRGLERRTRELGIHDDRSAYVVVSDDYKRGSRKERDYLRKHKNAVCRMYDNRCAKCGTDTNGLEIDHFFISKNEGGCFQMLRRDGLYVNNAIPLCEACNRAKADRHYRSFFSVPELARILELNAQMNERLNEHRLTHWWRG